MLLDLTLAANIKGSWCSFRFEFGLPVVLEKNRADLSIIWLSEKYFILQYLKLHVCYCSLFHSKISKDDIGGKYRYSNFYQNSLKKTLIQIKINNLH